MAKQYWLIRGYDGLKLIFDKRVSTGQIGDKQVEAMLKMLTAKAGLSYNEIVGEFTKKGTKLFTTHLHVHWDAPHRTLSCGSNPSFVAKAMPESELPKPK